MVDIGVKAEVVGVEIKPATNWWVRSIYRDTLAIYHEKIHFFRFVTIKDQEGMVYTEVEPFHLSKDRILVELTDSDDYDEVFEHHNGRDLASEDANFYDFHGYPVPYEAVASIEESENMSFKEVAARYESWPLFMKEASKELKDLLIGLTHEA